MSRPKRNHFLIQVVAIGALLFLLAGCNAKNQAAPGSAAGTADSAQPAASAANQPGAAESASDKSSSSGGIFSSTKSVTVPAATSIHVVLDQSLSSASSRPGDRFDATVVQPVVVDGETVIPRHSRVRGRVVDVDASGRLKGVARLEITLSVIEVNGKWYDLDTNNSTQVGQNHNKRNAVLMGGGAGLGALVGGLAGGGKGALIGAAAGGGAGTAGAAATGKKDVSLPAETALTFRLKSSITIPVKG